MRSVTGLLLGIDLGTSSSKAVLVTPSGQVVAQASTPHGISWPRPGWAEVDADEVWWADVMFLARTAVPRERAHEVAGICVSGVGPCAVVTDAADRPLRPAMLYGIDTRATRQIDELSDRFGDDALLERCGSLLSTQAIGPKLLWVRQNEPEVWSSAARWYSSSSYACARLTGEYVLDRHTASQSDPFYDIVTDGWCHDWVEEIAPGLELPRLVEPAEVVGGLLPDVAQAVGLRSGIPVSAGTIDACAEALSAGVRRPGDLMVMYGSTLFLMQVTTGTRTHPLLWATSGADAGSRTSSAGMATSGSLASWVQELTGGLPHESLLGEAEQIAPGSDGVVVLPYFAGERTPIYDPHARGVVAGLTLRHTRAHLYRAVHEGVACGVRQILGLLDEAAGPAGRVVAVGGGTRGGLWPQIVSDMTGREQALPAQTIGASYGSALLAGHGTGLVDHEVDWMQESSRVLPRAEYRPVYDRLFDAYCALDAGTRSVAHSLGRLA